MDQLSLIEKACAFCCGIMAEMGNLLGMSYQKINVILFCWIEPGIFIGLLLAFLWGRLHLPGSRGLAWVSTVVNTLAILTSVVLLCISTSMLLKQFHLGLENPISILNLNETNSLFVDQFNKTVRALTVVGGKLGISYAAVNLLYYVLLLPAGIVLCYWGIIRILIHKV